MDGPKNVRLEVGNSLAIRLPAAMESGCTVFCSEDLQHGHVIDCLTIRNPFAADHTN
jgi:predicted nucleic acid-binding protein